jgi:hypothetical protein
VQKTPTVDAPRRGICSVLFFKLFRWFHCQHKFTIVAGDVHFHLTSSLLKASANHFDNLDRSPSGSRLWRVVQGHDPQRVTIAARHPRGITQ